MPKKDIKDQLLDDVFGVPITLAHHFTQPVLAFRVVENVLGTDFAVADVLLLHFGQRLDQLVGQQQELLVCELEVLLPPKLDLVAEVLVEVLVEEPDLEGFDPVVGLRNGGPVQQLDQVEAVQLLAHFVPSS